jgi:hypothetical protein
MKTPPVNNSSSQNTSSITDVPMNLPPIQNRVIRTVEMVVEDTIKQIQQEQFQKNGTSPSGSFNQKSISQKKLGEAVIKALLKAEKVIQVPKTSKSPDFFPLLVPKVAYERTKPYLDGYQLLLEDNFDFENVLASYPQGEQIPALIAFITLALANYENDDEGYHTDILSLCDEFLAKKIRGNFQSGFSSAHLGAFKKLLDAARECYYNPIECSTSIILELALATCPSPILENIDLHTNSKNFIDLYGNLFTTLRTNLLSTVPQEELTTLLHLFPELKTVDLDRPPKNFIPVTESVTRLIIKNNYEITDEIIAKLDLATKAPQLQLLDLSSTNVSLENVKLPVAITEVSLKDCTTFSDTSLSHLLEQLPLLRKLSIARTGVTFSQTQSIKPHLEQLYLDGIHIENSQTFSSSLPIKGGLGLLSLNETRMPEGVRLPESITSLLMRGNKITNKQLSTMLQGLNKLSDLDITDSFIDLEGVQLPATLNNLVVCGTAVTTTTLNKALKDCKDLVEVDVSGTQVEPEKLEIEDKRKIRKEPIHEEIPVFPTQEITTIQSNQLDDDIAE